MSFKQLSNSASQTSRSKLVIIVFNLIERMTAKNDIASLVARVLNLHALQSQIVHGILEALAGHCAKNMSQYLDNQEFHSVSIARGNLFSNMVLAAMQNMQRREMKKMETMNRVEEWTESLL